MKTLIFLLLAPLTFREIVTIAVPYKDGQWLTIEGENEPLEKIFDFAYLEIITRGLNPGQIMFDVKPHNTEKWMKAYSLSEQLMKSL
jgi:hypothetical protein